METLIEAEAILNGISEHDAMLIVYLRTRSRWTQENEDRFILMARQGIPLPNILAGEDDED